VHVTSTLITKSHAAICLMLGSILCLASCTMGEWDAFCTCGFTFHSIQVKSELHIPNNTCDFDGERKAAQDTPTSPVVYQNTLCKRNRHTRKELTGLALRTLKAACIYMLLFTSASLMTFVTPQIIIPPSHEGYNLN
jgi:hypothetical protein